MRGRREKRLKGRGRDGKGRDGKRRDGKRREGKERKGKKKGYGREIKGNRKILTGVKEKKLRLLKVIF